MHLFDFQLPISAKLQEILKLAGTETVVHEMVLVRIICVQFLFVRDVQHNENARPLISVIFDCIGLWPIQSRTGLYAIVPWQRRTIRSSLKRRALHKINLLHNGAPKPLQKHPQSSPALSPTHLVIVAMGHKLKHSISSNMTAEQQLCGSDYLSRISENIMVFFPKVCQFAKSPNYFTQRQCSVHDIQIIIGCSVTWPNSA